MTESLERVVHFMKAGGQGVHYVDEQYVPTVKERELRLKLILEELGELATEGYGMGATFLNLLEAKANEFFEKDLNRNTLKYDPVMALDANCDLEVVVLGTYVTNGFTDIAEVAYTEVMDSNMSKFCFSLDDAHKTVANQTDWTFNKKEIGGKDVYAFHRPDNKIMKGCNYFIANLKKFFPYLNKENV